MKESFVMNQDSSKNVQQPKRMLRRKFLLSVVVIAFCVYFFNPFKPKALKTKKRLVILGFDGADPRLVEKWIDELPNLRKMMNMGVYKRMHTCYPPESPVAWSCFAIGANPGKHGVYDFLRRPVGSYFPSYESFVKKGHPRFLFKMFPIKMPKALRRRGGIAFWDVLSKFGVRSSMIEVPVTFPPPKLSHGRALSGLGVPDIRGIQATFHHFIYDKNSAKPLDTSSTFGGKIEELKPEGDWLMGHIWGPYDPIVDQEKRNKSIERVDAMLEKIEWSAHLGTLQGSKNFGEDKRTKLLDSLNYSVCGTIAYQEYLESEDFENRIQRLKHVLLAGKPYVKEKGVEATQTRVNHQKAHKKVQYLEDEIATMSKPIKLKVYFRKFDEETVEIKTGDNLQKVKLNQWSDWFSLAFPVMSFVKARAICRFYPQEISNDKIKVYMTSPDIDPRKPIIPISHPKGFSKDLADWLGEPYKTRGWASETHGLKDGHLDEDGYISDLNHLMDQREKKIFETFERTENNFFISVMSETDRVAHMFYRFIDTGHPMYDPVLAKKYKDVIKDIYIRMDKVVGRMMEKIKNDPDASLIVMSDHGFASFRYQVHINKWLLDNGFLSLKGSKLQATNIKLESLLQGENAEWFNYVDWKKTKAYSMGLGQIYINKLGREPLGIVKDKEYLSVCKDIVAKMQTLVDDRPERNNEPVVAYVKRRDEIWSGPFANDEHDCPDLQVCFNSPYRVSWQTCLGGISPGHVVEDNMETWSGDHCSMAAEQVPGIFFCNRPIKKKDVSIMDFAPTVLRYFGLKPPKAMEGKDLGIQGK